MSHGDTARLRLSDAEREEAAGLLGEHYAAGRLTLDEHGERTEAAYAARSLSDLKPLFADLPGGPPRTLGSRTEPARRWRPRSGLPPAAVALAVVLLLAWAVAHLPFVLAGLLAWCLLVGRRRRTRWEAPQPWACRSMGAARSR